ncbi:MAG: RNA methyltransferase [Dehalococcoidales bacterium]|nr:RNA methyltransferase [Dehalococcoidales bacterium]
MSESLKTLKWYRELADVKGRRESGCFPVEGARAVRQIAGQHPEAIIEILVVGDVPLELAAYPARQLTESQFRSVSSAATPQGLMAVVRLPEDSAAATLPPSPGQRILLLEGIQDPGNAGTLIRTAAALDYSGIILSDTCADPFSPKCVQAAAGTVLSLWLRRTERYLELIQTLQGSGYTVAATTLEGDDDISVLNEQKLILALGNEAGGLSGELLALADSRFRIPVTREKAESLNVAVCGGICMYLSGKKQ